MHVALITQYFWPESVGPGIFLHQLASDLVQQGHQVSVVTTFPNYPGGKIAEGYRGRVFMRHAVGGIQIVRSWIYATESKEFWHRVANFGSFCGSAFFAGAAVRRPDVFYVVMPPLPLGVTAEVVGRAKGAPVVVNVQDIYPDIAVELGYLRNRRAIGFFQKMEGWIYRHAAEIVVISERFRENLLKKDVPAEKIHVVPNWADAEEIQPAPKHNQFRRELDLDSEFTLIYSGTLSHNSSVDVLVEAASLLAGEPYRFVVVGEGVHKAPLQALAEKRRLSNIRFLPFQPLEMYPQVLAAADVQLVSLNAAASQLSLPSKMLKIMAAGRPVLAQAAPESDVARIIRQGEFGVAVDPSDPHTLADAVRRMSRSPEELQRMGRNARKFFLENFDRRRCVAQLEAVMLKAAGRRS